MMASITLQVSSTFAPTTSVAAYKATDWNPAVAPSGSPPGSAVETASVQTDGTLTFATLTEGATYYAYAGSPDRYIRFTVDSERGSSGDPESVESSIVIAQTKFPAGDGRAGLVETQTEQLGTLTRTVTYTRDTDDGFITGIDYGAWA